MSKFNNSTTDELRRTSARPLSWPAPGPALQPQLQPSIVMFIVVYRLSRGRRPGTYLDIYICRFCLLTTLSCHADITRQYTVYWEITMKVLCSLFSVSIGNHSSDYEQAVALSVVYSEVRSVRYCIQLHQDCSLCTRPCLTG